MKTSSMLISSTVECSRVGLVFTKGGGGVSEGAKTEFRGDPDSLDSTSSLAMPLMLIST